jgi:hypothetical protein
MKDSKIDNYIALFEQLVCHASYNIDTEKTLKYFTRGLPRALYETMYQHNKPRMYTQWRESALCWQQKWIHMQMVQGNLDVFKSSSNRGTLGALAKLLAPLSHPNAMDTSADCICRCVANLNEVITQNQQHPLYPPRDGYLQWQRQGQKDVSQVQCYNCKKRGHFSQACRQPRCN